MNEQNFNPQATLKSCLALSDALDRFLNYLEETFDLSADEATWMLAGIIHSQPCLTESNLETKKQLASMAQHIKICSAVHQTTPNEQN